MTESISPARRSIRLQDCVLLCCLPLHEEAFWRAKARSEFCSSFTTWKEYERLLYADKRMRQLKVLSDNGLRGTDWASFANFKRVALENSPLVCIAGHCVDNIAIEFSDRVVGIEEIVKALPSHFDGVLDVSACGPEGFSEFCKTHCPNSIVKSLEVVIRSDFVLLYYVILFEEILDPIYVYDLAEREA
ncbi:hypothetical protein [Methylocella sp.]|uniref:hypothetical protein n=1 Tax=Methylocella sp. TaxID=1978226 RepID=UPI0035AFAEA2